MGPPFLVKVITEAAPTFAATTSTSVANGLVPSDLLQFRFAGLIEETPRDRASHRCCCQAARAGIR
jgi:hypothetical protein